MMRATKWSEVAIIHYFFRFYCFVFYGDQLRCASARHGERKPHSTGIIQSDPHANAHCLHLFFNGTKWDESMLCLVFGSTHSYDSELSANGGKRDQMTCAGRKKRAAIITNVKKRKQRIWEYCCIPLWPTTFHHPHMLKIAVSTARVDTTTNTHQFLSLSLVGYPWRLALVWVNESYMCVWLNVKNSLFS